jgi:hypothetical protein
MRFDEYGETHVAVRNGTDLIGRAVFRRVKRELRVRGLFLVLLCGMPLTGKPGGIGRRTAPKKDSCREQL